MAYGNLLTDVVQSSTTNTPPVFRGGNGTETGKLCRAWVYFGYVSSAIIIRASFNVSSVTRNGTGDYTVYFTNAMPDTNFAAITGTAQSTGTGATAAQYVSGVDGNGLNAAPSASNIEVYSKYCRPDTSNFIDAEHFYVSVFR